MTGEFSRRDFDYCDACGRYWDKHFSRRAMKGDDSFSEWCIVCGRHRDEADDLGETIKRWSWHNFTNTYVPERIRRRERNDDT